MTVLKGKNVKKNLRQGWSWLWAENGERREFGSDVYCMSVSRCAQFKVRDWAFLNCHMSELWSLVFLMSFPNLNYSKLRNPLVHPSLSVSHVLALCQL